ncbi:MAG: TonB-dependent receptor [Pseudomonadota bacterium]
MANSNRTTGILPAALGFLSISTGAAAADQDQAASASQARGASAADAPEEIGTVEVTGYRLSLRNAIELKKNADVMMDAINAEDIADFPDANLAESLQRLPGISVDRENGEGKGITVRGLGSDFTRVRLNGLETLATTSASDSGTAPNRSRDFDFNVFASDLFSSLQVRKTASANVDEGSLGATVDLVTGKPLDYKGRKIALSAQDAFYENGGTHNPRVSALFADQWFDNKLGGSMSFAYSERDSEVDRYKRQAGQSDYLYRSSAFTGTFAPPRAGFSAPAGTTFGAGVTNPNATAVMTGSDPAAYAALYPGAPINTNFTDSIVRIPSLLNIEQQDLAQKRLGATIALQWRPSDSTSISFDGVYSTFDQKSDVNQIQSVGLNRNNTVAGFNVVPAAISARRGTYPTCVPRAGTTYIDPIDCGGTDAMAGGVFAGLNTTSFSTNPHNLEPYDYYNNPLSVGYPGAAAVAAANGLYGRAEMVGRPGVDVLAAHVSAAGNADYLQMRNIDWRSATDSSYFTTQFQQGSINIQQDIGDQLKMDVLFGRSRSTNDNSAYLVEFNRMDSPETFTYDERDHGSMPLISYGFDLADPAQWSLVKGFSTIRHFERETDNDYQGGHLNFELSVSDSIRLEFGGTRREYKFKTNQAQRLSTETLNPTLLELGVNAADLGRVYQFGDGLDLPAGAPTAFFAPNMDAFREITDFDCDCVNRYGDYRLSYTSNPGNQFGVDEYDTSYFGQVDWNFDVFGHRLFGNYGMRRAETRVSANGFTTAVAATGPRPLQVVNTYSDDLPSVNLAYQLTDELLLRAGWAKVMARPLLPNLAPTISAITTPSAAGAIGTLTIGNPYLAPFRATNYDLSLEWYFNEGGLLSLAVFKKDVSNFPQTVSTTGTIQSILPADAYAAFLQTQTGPQQLWLQPTNGTAPGVYSIRQFQNAPGGTIKGYELSYQQDLKFLPGWARNFGVQANYTHLSSDLQYILDPGSTVAPLAPQVTASGPFLGASPEAANFTLYYETPKWSARTSWAYRAAYNTTYPLAAGTCAPGLLPGTQTPCASPLINDFIGSKATRNIDANVTIQITDHLSVAIDLLNLTNQTEDRWAYQDDPLVTQYSSTGRQIFAGFRLSL